MKKYIPLLVLLVSTSSFAADMFLDAGLGIFDTEGPSISQVKFGKLGVESDLISTVLKQRISGGGWIDTRGGGYKGSVFGAYQVGFDVKNELLEMSIFSGPSLISSTDIDLGGNFQFNDSVYFGIRDPKTGNSIGVVYNHFSSAGLEMPNNGKDFAGLEIKFPF